MGGCLAARFRRVPARVVARQAAVRGHACAARAAREAADLGRRPPQLHVALPRAALGRRRWRSCSSGWCRGCRPQLRKQILERAEGVPLYAVETVRMLLDRGLLVARRFDLPARRARSTTLEVPETLHALIAARLDGLAPEERRLLGDAAVLGKTFTSQALAALSGLESDEAGGASHRRWCDARCSGCSRTRALRSRASTRSCRTCCGTSPTRPCRSESGGRSTWRPPSTSRRRSARKRSSEVVASHLLDAYRLDPEADDSEGTAHGRRTRLCCARAPERARSAPRPRRAATSSRPQTSEPEPHDRAAALSRAGEMAAAAADDRRRRPALRAGDRPVRVRSATPMRPPVPRVGSATRPESPRSARARRSSGWSSAYAVIGEDEPDADLAFLLTRLGGTHFFVGNLERANELTERALDVAEALQLPEHLARALEPQSDRSSPQRRPQEARGLLQLALDTNARARALPERERRLQQPLRRRLPAGSVCGGARFTSSRHSSSHAGAETVRGSGRCSAR